MIFIHEGQLAVGLDAIGEIGITAGYQNQITLERAVLVYRAGAVKEGVKAIVRAEFSEDRAFGEKLRGGCGNEKLVGVERVNDFSGFQVVEFHAEI